MIPDTLPDTVVSPSANVLSKSATRRATILRFSDSTVQGDLLADLGTLGEDILFYATMESLFDLPYNLFTKKILQEYPKLPSHVLEALYHRKHLDSPVKSPAQFHTALLASPARKENAVLRSAQNSPLQTTPRRRRLTASNVNSHSRSVDPVNPSRAHISPPLPERTPSLTTSITTSGSDDELCPVTPPATAGNIDKFHVDIFTPPQSPSVRGADPRAIPEKDNSSIASLSKDVDDVTVPVAPQRNQAVPFHLYYADPRRPVMAPMYRTKPKGWSSLFIPPARLFSHRRNDSRLDPQVEEGQQGEGTREAGLSL